MNSNNIATLIEGKYSAEQFSDVKLASGHLPQTSAEKDDGHTPVDLIAEQLKMLLHDGLIDVFIRFKKDDSTDDITPPGLGKVVGLETDENSLKIKWGNADTDVDYC